MHRGRPCGFSSGADCIIEFTVSQPEALRGVFGKIERAREQIEALRAESDAFWGSYGSSIVVEPYRRQRIQKTLSSDAANQLGVDPSQLSGVSCLPDGRFALDAEFVESFRLRFHLKNEPPTLQWSITIGEIVHNLRSALDHLVFELSRRNQLRLYSGGSIPPNGPISGSNPWRSVSFPILENGGTNDNNWKSVTRSKLKFVKKSLLPKFRSVQPFAYGRKHPEKEPLAQLDQLWQIDKHRSVHLVSNLVRLQRLGTGGPVFKEPDAPLVKRELTYRRHMGTVHDGVCLARIRLLPTSLLNEAALEEYMRNNFDLAFEIAFENGGYGFSGRPVVRTLMACLDATTYIVSKFDSEFQ